MDHLDMLDIRTAVINSGNHWFDKDTMRFFRCRVLDKVYQGKGGIYFVSSEKLETMRFSLDRAYTVRRFFPDTASIETVGEFNALSKYMAQKLAARYAKEGVES